MKVFASHSSVLDNIGDPSKEAESEQHLQTIAQRLKTFGAHIIEVTRYNVAVEIAEHRLVDLFDVVIDDTEGFLGKVEAKLHALKNYVDHLEICPPGGNSGS